MQRKYIPYIALLFAALLLFWVKRNQQKTKHQPGKEVVKIEAPAIEKSETFNRNETNIQYSKHAKCRMECREIDESEVKEIIKSGVVNESKIEEDKRGKTYPLEGTTHDGQRVRIVVAPKENALVIVTVIDLDTEWKCNCY
jgi:hypothetical protein